MKFLFHPYVLIAAAILLSAWSGYLYLKGRSDCVNAQALKSMTATIETREAMNEIRNNRVDTAGLVDRLHKGTF